MTIHTETPGRSGISAQSLSNFPGADVPGLSKPCFERCCRCCNRPSRADGGCYPEGCRADSIALSAGFASSSRPGALWAGGMASASALYQPSAQPFGHAQELRCSPTKTVQAILKTQLRWGSGGCAEGVTLGQA